MSLCGAQDQEAKKALEAPPPGGPDDPQYMNWLYAMGTSPARYAVERHQWAEAAALMVPTNTFPGGRWAWTEANLHFARAKPWRIPYGPNRGFPKGSPTASGMLFANDHDAGRTFIFDVRDALHPTIETSFTDMAGYMHPHSFLRLPNGHVLATFQHAHHSTSEEHMGTSGGLVEIDDQGKVVRASSNADPTLPDALLSPYSLVVLPELDRVVSTNSSMHQDDIFRGVTYQVWRLSDLKLLRTEYFEVGENHYAQISPEEPRLGPDGSVYVQTLGCGIERITGVSSDQPKSQLVYTFPGNWCEVPTIVGHYLVQSVPGEHALIVLDIANGAKPVEVSRLNISETFKPHWTGWDAKTQRLVVTVYIHRAGCWSGVNSRQTLAAAKLTASTRSSHHVRL